MNKDEEIELLKEALIDMVYQHCHSDEDNVCYDSMCLSSNAYAIETLIEMGVMEQVGDSFGRAIKAKFVK